MTDFRMAGTVTYRCGCGVSYEGKYSDRMPDPGDAVTCLTHGETEVAKWARTNR